MRFILGIFVTFLTLLSLALPARADAVRDPATTVRQWAVTTSTTAARKDFTSTTGVGGATRAIKSCHVRVIHGSTAASGDPDIYISLTNTAADIVAPTDGSQVFTLKAGESLGFDGEFYRVRYLAASGSPTLRIIASFNEQ